jgi:hypothetical protein
MKQLDSETNVSLSQWLMCDCQVHQQIMLSGRRAFVFSHLACSRRTAMGGMRDVPCGVRDTSLVLRVGVTAR